MEVFDTAAPSVSSLSSWPIILVTLTTAFTALDNLLIAKSEDPRESSTPISAVKDSPACSSVKIGEDVLG